MNRPIRQETPPRRLNDRTYNAHIGAIQMVHERRDQTERYAGLLLLAMATAESPSAEAEAHLAWMSAEEIAAVMRSVRGYWRLVMPVTSEILIRTENHRRNRAGRARHSTRGSFQ